MKNTILVMIIVLLTSYQSVAQSNPNQYNNQQQNNYQQNDYNYYQQTRRSALHKRNFGIILTVVGFGAAVAGEVIYNDAIANNQDIPPEAAILYLTGLIACNVGIVLWISGGVKAANNRKAIERLRYNNYQSNLSFGTTKNGVGLRLSF